jgi:ATP-dependent Clp protease ATP-binding subunit ClpX
MVTVLDDLTADQLVSILADTQNALTKQYAKLLAMEGVDLQFSDDALRALADQALKKGTGARALRSLLEKLMLDLMYDIPGSPDISGVTLTRQFVESGAPPLIRHKADQQAA